MTKMTKLFLTLSVVCFGLGFTGPGSEILHGGLKPIGAIAFIAFFISNLLAKEVALFDAESRQQKPTKQVIEREETRCGVPQHA
jgi:hypothetical protein